MLRFCLLVLMMMGGLPGGAAPAGATPPFQLPTSAEGFRAVLRRPGLPDTLRVICLNNLSRFAQASDPAAARAYVAQALALARRVGYRRGEANAWLMQGSIATTSHDALTSQTSTLRALALFRALGNRKGTASALQGLGTVAVLVEDQPRALRYYRQADSTFRLLTPPCLWCELNVQSNIANAYTALGRLAEAGRVYRQVLARTEGQDDSFAQLRVAALAGVAGQQARTGQPDSAVQRLHQALALARRLDDQYLQTVLLNSLSDRYGPAELANPPLRARYARQAVALGRTSGQQEPLQQALGNLADALHQRGNPAAYDTLRSYVRLSQALHEAERIQALADAQTRYDVAGQQAQIRLLQKDRRLAAQARELAALRARQERAGAGAGALLALLLAAAAFRHYRRRQAARTAAAAQAAAAALRQRLAADLHDDVGNLLTQISMQSNLLRENPHSPAQHLARLDQLTATARQAAQHMSDVVHGLYLPQHSLPELLDRLRDHAHEVCYPLGIEVAFDTDPEVAAAALSPAALHALYLIFKESLHNTVKHALATCVTVRLSATPTALYLRLADNGRGPAPARPAGHGLLNMQARAQAVGGTVRYETLAPGFAVFVELPVRLLNG